MTARSALRTATADDHHRVDDLFSRFQLTDARGYRRFLQATARAHVPVEAGLERSGVARLVPDWPERRRGDYILRDLQQLGVQGDTGGTPWRFASESEMLGALYVIEGSRLGGAMLRRLVPADLPTSFLNAPAARGAWRRLGSLLDQNLSQSQKLDEAIRSARQVFGSFAGAAFVELEPA